MSKRIVGEHEQRRRNPDEGKEKCEPRERQKSGLQSALPILDHVQPAAPLPMRCPDDDHHDAAHEDNRLSDLGVHSASSLPTPPLDELAHRVSKTVPSRKASSSRPVSVGPIRQIAVRDLGFSLRSKSRTSLSSNPFSFS